MHLHRTPDLNIVIYAHESDIRSVFCYILRCQQRVKFVIFNEQFIMHSFKLLLLTINDGIARVLHGIISGPLILGRS